MPVDPRPRTGPSAAGSGDPRSKEVVRPVHAAEPDEHAEEDQDLPPRPIADPLHGRSQRSSSPQPPGRTGPRRTGSNRARSGSRIGATRRRNRGGSAQDEGRRPPASHHDQSRHWAQDRVESPG